MDALTTLYTTLETLQEEGKLTDGVYLAAMNALQVVYNSVPRPPPTATAAQAPPAGEPPAWKTIWQTLFSTPWPVYFNTHIPDYYRALLTAMSMWSAIPAATRPPIVTLLTHDLWVAHGAVPHGPEESLVDYCLDILAHVWAPRHGWHDEALAEALRNDPQVRANRLTRAIKQVLFWQKEFATFADLSEFSPSNGKMARWLYNRTSGLYGTVKRRRGRGWATEPTDTTHLHRVKVAFPSIVDTTEWSAEFWTPRVQLGRCHLARTLTVLRVIATFLHGGDFQREMLWCSLTERADDPTVDLRDWSDQRGMDLVVSGITGSTRQMRRTYSATRPDNLTGPWLTITYQDPLNTGAPAVENATE